jgi:Fe-Mn family superoxide dismutase
MKYQAQDYSHLQNIGKISNEAMALHLKLYAGYVANSNTIVEKLEKIGGNVAENLQEFNELHRRFGWEYNGMKLHEIFFGNLTNEATEVNTELPLIKKIAEIWGSFEVWKAEFYNIAKMRGFGWTMLVECGDGALLNTWVNEHDVGVPANCKILFVADMLEHAYITDFGTDRVPYLDSLFAHVDWERINNSVI